MKSIFFSVQNRRRNLRLFQSIKEFIEHQEGLGNKVLLPKLNEEIIIVNPNKKIKTLFLEYDRFSLGLLIIKSEIKIIEEM